ncbi:MAG: transcriptional repressor [Devosiaceae bacterium]|nr:transcriptional repressor [Devosiaceae bacterium MH13]
MSESDGQNQVENASAEASRVARDALVGKLRRSGLRPTRQRLALAEILFDGKDRHVSAEWLHEIAKGRGAGVSLATVYNTLHQFTGAGLLREITVDSSRTYFDTNTGDHHHMFLEHEDRVVDVPSNAVSVNRLPEIPEGMELVSVDVVVRVRPKAAS